MVKGGMFSSNYIAYKVTTLPLKYMVLRRFSDFYWLRNILVREYPGHCIPPMAQKGGKR
jgi:sorting nexin-7/30/sorting nexin-8